MNKSIASAFGGLVAAVVVIGGWWAWADLYSTNLGNFIQGHAFWLVWVAVFIVGAILAMVAYDGDSGLTAAGGILGGLMVVVAIVGFAVGIFRHGYDTRQQYLSAIEVTDEAAPSFNQRAPFDVANNQAQDGLLDVNGDIVDTDYVSDEDVFASIVERPGFFQGYEVIEEQTVGLTGSAKTEICRFSDQADARLNGNFSHALERQIAHVQRGLIIDDSDAYGYCDGETPMVVVPVKNHVGWFPAVEMPAGVFTYNGETGELKYYENVTAEDNIPGPVFPISLAVELREATAAMGGYWDYMKERVGYTDTSNDEGDPNGSNRSEFALSISENEHPAYVTPLTPRRNSSSITAIGVVDASTVTAGQMNTYQVHKLTPQRQANSVIAEKITEDYGDLPEWATGRLRIHELVPVTSNEWVASLGQEKTVTYRVRVTIDPKDREKVTTCLETAEGEQIRCGKRTAQNGNGPGVDLAPGENGPNVDVPQTPEALQQLSDQELAQLLTTVSNEVLRRSGE